MRRKPSSQNAGGGFGNQHRSQKPRFGGSGGGSQSQGSYNRPRKNYAQAREKYLAQARDALAAGDRVLAENYLQHADHCYRMLMEEGAHRQQQRPQQPSPDQQTEGNPGNEASEGGAEEDIMSGGSALPAFITGGYEHAAPAAAPAPVQDWEERDAN